MAVVAVEHEPTFYNPACSMTQQPTVPQSAKKTDWGRARAWVSILLIVPVGIVLILSQPPLPAGSPAQLGYDVLGWVCFTLGATLRWWATLYIGSRKGHKLMVEGPYSLCRNPLYLGTFLITISIGVTLGSLWLVAWMCLVSMLYLQLTLPNEESRLANSFGDDYSNYRQSVPLFIPRLSHYRAPETLNVSMAGLKSELRRMLRWMWVPLLCQFLITLRNQSWWADYIHIP